MSSKLKLEVSLPVEIVDKIDKIIKVIGFDSRDELLIVAVRRLVDRYYPLISAYVDDDN